MSKHGNEKLFTVILEILTSTLFLYFSTFLIGLGLSQFLFQDKEDIKIYSPWIGIIQIGLISILFGFFDIGSVFSFWISALVGVLLYLIQYLFFRNRTPISHHFSLYTFSTVLLVVLFFMTPVLVKSKKMTSFTIGNNDLFDYCVTANFLQRKGLKNYLNSFGDSPASRNASIEERVISWQIPAPRWLAYYPLSSLSAILKTDVADLFSLYIIFLYALSLPILWKFSKSIAQLEGKFLFLGVVFAYFNPHIITILYHGFLPQVMGTALFLSFFSLFPAYINKEELGYSKGVALSLFAAGVLASYLEIFSFLIFIVVFYSFWIIGIKKYTWSLTIKKLALLFGVTLLLCPYQTKHFISIILFHAAEIGGGWRVTHGYYLLPFQLGFVFSNPAEPSQLLEWILNPILFILLYLGIKDLKEKEILLCMLIPFLISGAIAFNNDWNYRYFKNFTYLYYWAPLLITKGTDFYLSGKFFQRKLHRIISIFLFLIIFISILRTSLVLYSSIKSGQFIPEKQKLLSKLNKDPKVNSIFITGLNFWETMWAGYYLKDKNVLAPTTHPYLRNDIGPSKDSPLH